MAISGYWCTRCRGRYWIDKNVQHGVKMWCLTANTQEHKKKKTVKGLRPSFVIACTAVHSHLRSRPATHTARKHPSASKRRGEPGSPCFGFVGVAPAAAVVACVAEGFAPSPVLASSSHAHPEAQLSRLLPPMLLDGSCGHPCCVICWR